jgi:hypothetical protein
MHTETKKNLMVIGALLLPVLLIVGVFTASKLKASLVNTEYDFLYSICDRDGSWYGDCAEYLRQRYTVVNQRIIINEAPIYTDRNYDGIQELDTNPPTIRIFRYDVKEGISREMLKDEVLTFSVDPRLTSPDGVVVEGGSSSGGMELLFFDLGSSYSYDYYLVKGSKRKPLNLATGRDNYYYSDNFKFVGWVTK